MLSTRRLHVLCAVALSAVVLLGIVDGRLAAQTTTGTILGTVTDSSGGAIPDASVQLTNTGTGAVQRVTSDAEGRYRIPAVAVGNYEIQSQKAGFEQVVHKGISVSVGADVVVDFSLPVGQVTQSVTVEGNVTEVETTSSALSNLVEPTQMRELPLNGRDMEQLVLLAPGVTIMTAINSTSSTFGFGAAYSVAGARAEGEWELLDDNDVINLAGRGSGAGSLGTSLGVDAVAEFQMLTNTYSAQYGGAGSVVVSVTKSGTNNFHGSGYEFFRSSALDARNFFDPPQIPLFQKNQFGGTLGGPIKKDKMFFFVNYEGIRQNASVPSGNAIFALPDAAAHLGYVPNANGVYQCVNNLLIVYPNPSCLATVPAPIQAMMAYSPLPSQYPSVPLLNPNGTINGLVSTTESYVEPGSENYVVGRYDWTISSKDSIFARDLYDKANFHDATASPTLSALAPQGWWNQDTTKNQFLSIEEKRIWSNNLITSTRAGFSRTLAATYQAIDNGPLWQFIGPQNFGLPNPENGSIRILTLVNPNIPKTFLGGGSGSKYIQNKFSGGEDIFWTKGAHGFRFGGSVSRWQTYKLSPPNGGTWTFANMTSFLTMSPSNYSGTCLAQLFATCAAAGFSPVASAPHEFLQTIYGLYIQDDWKVARTLTLNLGLRYAPESNPTDAFGTMQNALNLPFSASYNPNLPMPGCLTPARSSCPALLPPGITGYSPINSVYLKNPSFHNIDPRIGLAWDPFKDHKTSVRAGYGIFHTPIIPYDFSSGFSSSAPGTAVTQQCPAPANVSCSAFPTPFQSAGSFSPTAGSNIDSGITYTGYLQQYNLTVQRGIGNDTVVSLGYVGSHGVHLGGQVNENPELPTGVPGAVTVPVGKTLLPYPAVGQSLVGATAVGAALPGGLQIANTGATPLQPASANGQPIVDPTTGALSYSNVMCNAGTLTNCSVVANNNVDPTIGFWGSQRSDFWSRYNSLQASLVRRLANNFQLQISYTYSSCVATASSNNYSDGQGIVENPWNINGYDSGNCTFSVRDNLYTNGMYILPFRQNRLVSGWQLSGIFTHHTGNYMFLSNGWDSGPVSRTGVPQEDRPNYVAGCQAIIRTVANWVNPACYAQAPIGEPGNVGNNTIVGPTTNELDLSVVKNTKISEQFNLQFRAEAFNLFNHPNFRNPGQPGLPVFSEVSPLPATCSTTPSTCSIVAGNVGQIRGTDTSARQLQFALKLIF